MLGKTSWYSIDHGRQRKWQTHFALLQEMSLLSLASFCQSRAAKLIPPPPNSYRIRGYLCSFYIPWTTYLGGGGKYTPISGIGNYWFLPPPFWSFLGKASRDKHPKSTLFLKKMGTHMPLLMHSDGRPRTVVPLGKAYVLPSVWYCGVEGH